MLEEDVAVLVGSSEVRVIRVEACVAELLYSVHVAHFLEVLIIPDSYLLDLVGCSESVEEVEERNSAFDSCKVSYRSEVHDFLNVALSEHRESCLTAGIYVGVVSEDVQRVSRNRTGRYMEYCRQKLSCDLVHVRDHQEESLGSSVCGRQSACSEGTVYCACSACLRLHLDYLYSRSEDVLASGSCPLVYIVSHRRRRSDRIDSGYLCERVGDMCSSVVAVHSLELSFHSFISL